MHLILVGGPDTVRLVRAVVVVVPSPLASPSAAADARLRSSSASFRAASKISRSRIAGRERLVSASLSDRMPPYGFEFSSFSRSVRTEGKIRWLVGSAGNLGIGGSNTAGGGILGTLLRSLR